ncbi:MAG: hypothetical protein IPN46_06225, partial [Saprospiraceae bacterium]|nr:hypothetical protein [Saprospiraceae bacterium]
MIFTNGGASYNNIDNTQATFPVVDNYGPIDISNCTSVRFSMNFNFSDPWSGNPRMESPETCFAGGCTGVVGDALVGDCFNCWDFLNVDVFLDGSLVFNELIGVVGETRQSGVISWTGCTNGASNITIEVTNMNWAAHETNSFSNIQVECWDATPTATANPMPFCEGDILNLNGTIAVPADATSWM